MATQYTAGLSSGQILTAAIMNQIGAVWVDYTPTLTQNVTVTKTINNARYCQIQKTIIGSVQLVVTSAGTAGQFVYVGLPIAAKTTGVANVLGNAYIYDASTNTIYNCSAAINTSTTMAFYYQTGNYWGSSPNIALASSDQISVFFTYEAA